VASTDPGDLPLSVPRLAQRQSGDPGRVTRLVLARRRAAGAALGSKSSEPVDAASPWRRRGLRHQDSIEEVSAMATVLMMAKVISRQSMDNREHLRRLLKEKQPALSAALELAVDLVGRELRSPEMVRDISASEGHDQ
jgi:hypothetical protein